jgi:pimeloyl-ACP methyl ester carboxylesterase
MRLVLAVLAGLVLAGCTSTTPPAAPPSASPSLSPSASQAAAVQEVTFPATDGVALHGRVYGHGATAVILSNMGDNDPRPWDDFAPLLAARAYRVLTYSFRYPLRTNAFTTAYAQGTVPDLLGAVAYARAAGATRIVLIGASLGGITVGKVGAQAGAAAVVIISAEQDLSLYGLVVSAAELAALTVPKLFIASEQDTNTAYALTKQFYDNAPEPKQFHGYAGGVHGIGLFATADGDDLRGRLLDFVAGQVPA